MRDFKVSLQKRTRSTKNKSEKYTQKRLAEIAHTWEEATETAIGFGV